MQPWPGSRGPRNSRRGTYHRADDPDWTGRNRMLSSQMWQRGLRDLGYNTKMERAYGGGWIGPYGSAVYSHMRENFKDLQPGYVLGKRRDLGNAPKHGGFI